MLLPARHRLARRHGPWLIFGSRPLPYGLRGRHFQHTHFPQQRSIQLIIMYFWTVLPLTESTFTAAREACVTAWYALHLRAVDAALNNRLQFLHPDVQRPGPLPPFGNMRTSECRLVRLRCSAIFCSIAGCFFQRMSVRLLIPHCRAISWSDSSSSAARMAVRAWSFSRSGIFLCMIYRLP